MKRQKSTEIDYPTLKTLYIEQGYSMSQIAADLGCSLNKVDYWMRKYKINRRSRSEAVYIRKNPDGDPFEVRQIDTAERAKLFGLGIGLYWGEGNKANKHAVRIGNTDPGVIREFMKFLHECYGVSMSSLRFGLQLFSDVSQDEARRYWCRELHVRFTERTQNNPSSLVGSWV